MKHINPNRYQWAFFMGITLAILLVGSLFLAWFSPAVRNQWQVIVTVNALVAVMFLGACILAVLGFAKREETLLDRIESLEDDLRHTALRLRMEKQQVDFVMDRWQLELRKRLQFMKVQALKEGKGVYEVSGWVDGQEVRNLHLATSEAEVRALYPAHYADDWKSEDGDHPFIIVIRKA